MTRSHGFRVLAGFAAGWSAAVAVSFFVGCIFALFMTNGPLDLFEAAVSGEMDALNIFLFVGGASAAAAAPVALLAVVLIAWPLYLASKRFQSVHLGLYIVAGFGIAFVVMGVLLFLEHEFNPLGPFGYWVESVEIVIAGPVGALTFWAITRSRQADRNGRQV